MLDGSAVDRVRTRSLRDGGRRSPGARGTIGGPAVGHRDAPADSRWSPSASRRSSSASTVALGLGHRIGSRRDQLAEDLGLRLGAQLQMNVFRGDVVAQVHDGRFASPGARGGRRAIYHSLHASPTPDSLANHRPDPDELLRRVHEQEVRARRGSLKIFFGASPGVGKTFSMLEAAQAARRQGLDVVVGVVETHGRAETARLDRGPRSPAPPPRRVSRHHASMSSTWTRRWPAIPRSCSSTSWPTPTRPGSRHTKRWQDVEELLSAGVNVWSTLNVQHVESLNDVVAQITGVRVRETVPDSVLERADEVEMVDLTPDELIQRLREGKVYMPEQAVPRRRPVLPQGQPDRAPRNGAPPHRRAGGRADARLHGRAGHPGDLGDVRAAAGLRRPRRRRRAPGARRTPDRGRTRRAVDRACTSRHPAARGSQASSPRRSDSRSSWARRWSRCPGSTRSTRFWPTPGAHNVTRVVVAPPGPAALVAPTPTRHGGPADTAERRHRRAGGHRRGCGPGSRSPARAAARDAGSAPGVPRGGADSRADHGCGARSCGRPASPPSMPRCSTCSASCSCPRDIRGDRAS